ncbi:arabinose-5-phosphate isomerase [Desulfonatronum thiosulfatophilum]|uniref:Arabinose-5-phosphate isomerase n=1 Tax=Desulfonatronum thiosulfatophilum TaxID=617002 RepID=A0A1G6A160_9BACT|nr:KpsF/GutQ family sugar-phosphate isomerase [Desulfonatronum thiosulfatophilum]SDB02208.1 arabinose-5-phosphate isomerase [Desulfonatronum thiosulfatophilum]
MMVREIDQLPGPLSERQDWLALGREVLDVEISGLTAVRDELGQGFLHALEVLANCSGRVVVIGLGKSGLVGRKIAATLSSTGTPAFFLHPVEGAHGDLGMIRPEDVALAISNSGETDELNAILPTLRSLGVRIVGLTRNERSSLAVLCDIVIKVAVPKEACPLGLAPTASTTAALAVGDALAVCLIHWKRFDACAFQRCHPGGALGQRLRLSICDVMHRDMLPVVRSGASLDQALSVLNEGGLGTVAVEDEAGRLAGILTDGDIRRLVCQNRLDPELAVEEVMTRAPRSAAPDQTAALALDIMESAAITVLPVVDSSGMLRGMVHLHDLLGKGRVKFSG